MKFVLLSVLLSTIFCSEVTAESVRIRGMRRILGNNTFALQAWDPRFSIRLDCASFFHHLEVETREKKFFYYLDPDECWEIHEFYKDSLFTKKYLNVSDAGYRLHR
jgi:hypothetical protein